MASTLPQPSGSIAELRAEVKSLRGLLDVLVQTMRNDTEDEHGIPDGYTDPVACRIRARRQRIATSPLRAVPGDR